MTQKEIVLKQESAVTIAGAIDRYGMMVEFVRKAMTDGKDYGKIPGSDKPTLLKPGAEKLTSLFDLYPLFEPVQAVADFDAGLFFYQYRCSMVHRKTGETWGTGLGSCNSKESKYRYRYISTTQKPSKPEAEILKAKGLGRWRKQGNEWVWMERIENDQIFDLVNTIDKMAQKRALIAATLIACNASEFFTQDIEDMGAVISPEIVDAEYQEIPQQASAPAAEPLKAEPHPNGELNGKTPVYQAVVDAGLSENLYSAKAALNQCSTGYDTPEKAVAWMRSYRAWRDTGADSKTSAAKANKGELPK